jgi:uncharacterized protein with PQ loop repeat
VFYGPLVATRAIVKSKTTKGLPLPPLIFQLLQSLIWTIWAIYVKEAPIIIANVFGLIFGVMLIALWIWLSKQEILNGTSSRVVDDVEFQPIEALSKQTAVGI